jgi:hypothetical protein
MMNYFYEHDSNFAREYENSCALVRKNYADANNTNVAIGSANRFHLSDESEYFEEVKQEVVDKIKPHKVQTQAQKIPQKISLDSMNTYSQKTSVDVDDMKNPIQNINYINIEDNACSEKESEDSNKLSSSHSSNILLFESADDAISYVSYDFSLQLVDDAVRHLLYDYLNDLLNDTTNFVLNFSNDDRTDSKQADSQ